MRLIYLILLIVCLCSPAWAVSPLDWPYSCVCNIVAGDAGGSGTLVGVDGTRGIVVTAAHVVEGRTATHLKWPNGYETEGSVVDRNEQLDLAVIQCKIKEGMQTPRRVRAAKLSDGVVVAVGFPFYSRDKLHWTSGKVMEYQGSDIKFAARPYLHSGFSGGALLAIDGSFLGSTNGYGDNYSYAASGTAMEKFLSRWVKVGSQ